MNRALVLSVLLTSIGHLASAQSMALALARPGRR